MYMEESETVGTFWKLVMTGWFQVLECRTASVLSFYAAYDASPLMQNNDQLFFIDGYFFFHALLTSVFCYSFQKRRSGRQVKRRKYNEDLDLKVVDDDGETIAVLGTGRISALNTTALAWQAEV